MTQWEYKIIQIDLADYNYGTTFEGSIEESLRRLNSLGAAGWEAVAMNRYTIEFSFKPGERIELAKILLKRPKT